MRILVLIAAMFVITACTKLRPGTDLNNTVLSDSGSGEDASAPTDALIRPDATTARDAEPADVEPRDGEPSDREPGDIEPGDIEPGDDGILDAGDTGMPECVPEWGEPCFQNNACGATYDCFGNCGGGTQAPPCACGTPFCDMNNQWSGCPDPPDLGDLCDTMTSCGGQIDCSGACAGGAPLPVCECGTPTCTGCAGGTCDIYSTCTNGQCTCTVNDCSANGSTYCWNGALQTCAADAYGCGTFTAAQICPFGCMDFDLSCACSPETGFYCTHSTCFCQCGDFDRPGQVECDGSCTPQQGCPLVCLTECGPL